MRKTITLDDDAYAAALELSRSSGRSLGEVISQLIRDSMRAEHSSYDKSREGFPNFKVHQEEPLISVQAVRREWEQR